MEILGQIVLSLGVACLLPGVIADASRGQPSLLLLTVFACVVPTLLDEWIVPFLLPRDADVLPDPLEPDWESLSRSLSEESEKTALDRRTRTIHLCSVYGSTNRRFPYFVRFNVPGHPLHLSFHRRSKRHRSSFIPSTKLHVRGFACVAVDNQPGAFLRLAPLTDTEEVHVTVNDWRQSWTHSLAFGLALAAAATILLGIRSLPATLIPFILHVAWDQAGFQGCSFFWPFSGRKLSPRMWTSNPYSPRTVATLTWMVLICLFLSIRTQLSPAGTAPFRVIFYGISVPVIIWGIPRVWKNLRNGAGKRRLSVKTHVRRTIA